MKQNDRAATNDELVRKIENLENRLAAVEKKDYIFEKAFRVIGLHTNYAEFGVFNGGSLIQSYYCAKKVYDELLSGFWNHSFADHDSALSEVQHNWEKLNFFAFDSFQGIPQTTGPDKEIEIFKPGTYCCKQTDFQDNLRRYGVPEDRVSVIPGYFQDSCTPANLERFGFKNIGIIHIDSDLYESAKFVLNAITPYLASNAIIIFDEWFQFFGNPEFGEQRAFAEWREANPDWHVTEFQKEGAYRMSFILSRKSK
jgi:hypothetical protein